MERRAGLLIALSLGSCTMPPPTPAPPPNPAQIHEFERLVGGKVAQRPVACVPNFNPDDIVRIDARTIGFRFGGGMSYIVHLGPGCEELTNPSYTLVSHQFGGSGLCRNDVERVIDSGGMPVGSCTVMDVIPYVRP